MDGEIDLRTADRDVLIGIIIRQQAIIERLEKRVAQSEGKGKSGGSGRMPGLKPKGDGRADRPKKPRQPRRSGFARTRMTPDQRVEHALERCPDCGIQLSGGWTQRTREVIELPQVPVQVTEHAYIARACPQCQRRWVPSAELDEVVLGQQRLGINLVSLIAALREEARLPFRTIQWYLAAVHGRRLSVGAIVAATKGGRPSPGDDDRHRGTDPRQSGGPRRRDRLAGGRTQRLRVDLQHPHPTLLPARYFLRRGRGKTVVDEVLGDEFAGVLVSDFYAAYHHYDGPKQRCWAHLLRDIHDRRVLYPDDLPLVQWADAVHQLYQQAKAFTHPSEQRSEQQRRAAQLALERRLLALCRPYRDDPASAQARLCRRISNHIKELFVFVAHPEVPPDNNAAERSLRHLVISRKISGGTRSSQGTETKMALASICGTWRTQDLNTLTACRQLLISPQV